MRRWRLLLLPVLLAGLISVRDSTVGGSDASLVVTFLEENPDSEMLYAGQDDFSLGDALFEGSTKKPPVTQKTPSSDPDDFDLFHALDPDDPKPHPPANPRDTDNPKRDQPKGSDTFDDSDLLDGNFPKGGSDGSGSNERKGPAPKGGQEEEGSPGAIAGIVSAVAATAIGAVSSFIAYQKKKLCFKQSDEENVNMDSHRGAQSEPPVQRTLLEN